jgi:hypothetical protein
MFGAGAAGALGVIIVAATTGGASPVPPPAEIPAAPASPPGCRDTLRTRGIKHRAWPLRPQRLPSGVTCEAPEGVAITQGASTRFQPPARVNCAFALRLLRFEQVMQEEAKRLLGSPVRALVQLGTYNCRRMAAYPDLVSEHSFANAIDIARFILKNGRTVVVERDWVRAEQAASTPAARFLRRLTRRLYDEQVFSVVLTPSYDHHHRNHLHLDGAAYSVDGTI